MPSNNELKLAPGCLCFTESSDYLRDSITVHNENWELGKDKDPLLADNVVFVVAVCDRSISHLLNVLYTCYVITTWGSIGWTPMFHREVICDSSP